MGRKQYTEDDYRNRCKELGNEYVGFRKVAHKGTVIDFICNKHRDKGVQSADWGHYKLWKHSCPYCSGRYRTTEEAQRMVLNPNIEFISEYHGSEKPIRCRCHKCGNEWTTNRPIDLFKRSGGYPVCGRESTAEKRRKPQEEFEKEMKSINPNIKITGIYRSTHKPIKCKCLIDGYEWESHPSNLLNGSAGCPICNSSVGEKLIVQFMEKNNIQYERQKTFPDCKDIFALKFDVYDVDNNIAIEFQGEQHYFPIDYAGFGEEYAKDQFDKLQRRDRIKKEYCYNNGITLICIPYWYRQCVGEFLIDNVDIYKEIYERKTA